MVGRQTSGSAEAATPAAAGPALIDAAVSEDALPELLARVEASAEHNAARARRLTFPEELPADQPASLVPDQAPEEMADPAIAHAPAGELPEAPPSADGVPEEGWAVEVGAYEDAEAADGRVEALREQGREAWRIESFEQGVTRFRVRVGTWQTKAAAAEALGELRDSLGQDDLIVTGVR